MGANLGLIFASLSLLVSPLSSRNQTEPQHYLIKYGYMEPRLAADPSPLVSGPADITDIGQAVRRFQRFVGLHQSGVLDDQTLLWMQRPRCGVKDHQPSATASDSPQPFQVGLRIEELGVLAGQKF